MLGGVSQFNDYHYLKKLSKGDKNQGILTPFQ